MKCWTRAYAVTIIETIKTKQDKPNETKKEKAKIERKNIITQKLLEVLISFFVSSFRAQLSLNMVSIGGFHCHAIKK